MENRFEILLMLQEGAMLVDPSSHGRVLMESWLTYPLILLFLVNLALFRSNVGRALVWVMYNGLNQQM